MVLDKLAALLAFLEAYLSRRARRPYAAGGLLLAGGGALGQLGGGGEGELFKRQRLETAATEEDRRSQAVRGLLLRAGEALRLLQARVQMFLHVT